MKLLESRPVAPEAIAQVLNIVSENCTFIERWEDLRDTSVMKVFGKKDAEREAILKHEQVIAASGQPLVERYAKDKMSLSKTHVWRPASEQVKVASFFSQ